MGPRRRKGLLGPKSSHSTLIVATLKILILHNVPAPDSTADDFDVYTQRDAIVAALQQLGHHVSSLGCTLNLEQVQRDLQRERPDVVWNLVESLGSTDRLVVLPVLLLEAMGIPFTGSGSAALLATTSKLVTKDHLRRAGLPTPDDFRLVRNPATNEEEGRVCDQSSSGPTEAPLRQGRWIIKPVWEHASVGMDDDCVVSSCDRQRLLADLRMRQSSTGRAYFAERYIAGREFNLALLNGRVLPPAEMDFSQLPSGRPHILGYRAKWDESSPEYHQTRRTFPSRPEDQPLLDHLAELARRCWSDFELAGHVRVDFRVDEQQRPWILEINVNPCLAPDAGFAAALSAAGIPWQTAIESLVLAAVERHPRSAAMSIRAASAPSHPTP